MFSDQKLTIHDYRIIAGKALLNERTVRDYWEGRRKRAFPAIVEAIRVAATAAGYLPTAQGGAK